MLVQCRRRFNEQRNSGTRQPGAACFGALLLNGEGKDRYGYKHESAHATRSLFPQDP